MSIFQTAAPSLPTDRARDGDTLWTIQYLRGAAALAVTIYHALQWVDGGFEVGRAGVDIFFVISGVIMWRVTRLRPSTPGEFLARRAGRVAPLYWLMTLLVWGIALRWPDFLPEVLPQGRHLALSLAFIPHFDPVGRPFPLLPPGWTLTYEAIFYLIFAAALFLPARLRAVGVTAGLAGLVGLGFILQDPVYVLGGNPMLLQFAAGVWLGVAMDAGALPDRRWGLAWMILGLGVFTGLQISGYLDELWRPLIWGTPAAMLVMGALCLEAGRGAPRLTGLRAVGDASYALYLVHLPATALVAHTLGWERPWLFVPAAVAASLGAAFACHRWIEKPLIQLIRRGPSTASIGRM